MGSSRWGDLSLHFRLTMGLLFMLALLVAGGLIGLSAVSSSSSDLQSVTISGVSGGEARTQVDAAIEREGRFTRLVAVLFGLGTGAVLVTSGLVSLWIRRPLKELRIGAENLSAGRLDYRIPIRRRDEFGEVLELFNSLAAAVDAGQETLEHQAFHDTLTGLPNRALFQDRLQHALARQSRQGHPLSVLLLDVDDFKTVNDSLGHAAGDELLRLVAGALGECLRPADTAARLGGDEFAILVEDGRGRADAVAVARRIIEALSRKMVIEGKEVFVHASVGIAITYGSETSDDVLRNADVAMYAAKAAGKAGYQIFDGAMHEDVMQRLDLKADLQRAVNRNEFEVHYQPLFDLDSGRILSAEALVRWRHPDRGLVAPNEFIPLAEETGLILPIGHFVLGEAVRQLRWWQMHYDNDFTVSVNLSGRQLQEPDIVDLVRDILRTGPIAGKSLTLELTESVLMTDTEATIEKLRGLCNLGIHLAIDDFGTGYSSLAYLRRFPIETIKIDRSFTEGVAFGPEDSALARAVIKLAETLGMKTIAEGVESKAQVEELSGFGCRVGQGFIFSPAVLPDEFEALMTRQRSAAPGEPQPTATF
jgi:diguanylate cyclase (GGDEF)-like protein